MNELHYGDNLAVLRESVPTESVDLIYLDPPFNSNASYNVLFKGAAGDDSAAQIEAFDDTWTWSDMVSGQAMAEVQDSGYEAAGDMLTAMVGFLGKNAMTAYLAMMAVRLVELHRVLKPTGSLYLHCDPTASHYLKILLDAVFGATQFRNEIVWKRAHTVKGNFGQGAKHFDRNTDTILFYAKSSKSVFHPQFKSYSEKYQEKHYNLTEPETGRRYQLISMSGPGGAAKGNPEYEVMGVRRHWRYSKQRMAALIEEGRVVQTNPDAVPRRKLYLDEGKGVPLQAMWDDIAELNSQAQERLGYPTQKPQALLERIIAASSNPGDTVLDPFCGCGTTIEAAEKLKRRWIGIDVTPIAITLIRHRLFKAFEGSAQFEVRGLPRDLDGARMMFAEDDSTKKRFEMWAVGQIDAYPQGGGKKGADGGIDGFFRFGPGKAHKALVSVKGGRVSVPAIRELDAVVTRDKAAIGVLLTLEKPTKPMLDHAAQAGTFAVEGFPPIPRIQIVTIAETFRRGPASVNAPLRHSDTYKGAPVQKRADDQGTLL